MKFIFGLGWTLSFCAFFLTEAFHLPVRGKVRMIQTKATMDTNQIVDDLLHDQIQKLYFDDTLKHVIAFDQDGIPSTSLSSHPVFSSKLIDLATLHHVPVVFQEDSGLLDIAGKAVQTFLVFSLILIAWNIIQSFATMNGNGRSRGNGFLPFPSMIPGNIIYESNVTFADWCGSPEVLRECVEVVSFLNSQERFVSLGARIPKGILLEGPPGTGKTLLAKAIAGEAKANFISISGSEFVELFVGMGASRVRKLFAEARKKSPCVLFIDEIDAVGRQRGAGVNLGNDEREQTLNQLLAEMDGFQSNENILVIAATNRQDVLDAALLRPGRFDRIINVPLPDTPSRQKILEIYARNKPFAEDVDLEKLAVQTSGFSGAEIENLLNEAALMSARKNLTMITYGVILEAKEKLLVGIQREHDTRSLETRRRVAIHEAGHAVLCLLFDEYFDFVKVTIQDTYSGAGGYTIFEDKPEVAEHGLYTKDYLKKRLRIMLGGRAAESLYYGDDFVSVGATEDLRQVNELARRMINQFGMGEQIENYHDPHANDDNPFLGRTMGTTRSLSEELASTVDKEILSLVKDAYQDTKKLLKERESLIGKMVEDLLAKRTLFPEDIRF